MSSGELAVEQRYLTELYRRVDALRAEAAEGEGEFWRGELARLESVEDGLCFGRLDLTDGRRVYIGRIGLFDGDEPLLLDWRAPAARPFYTATAVDAQGVRRRRRITTRGRTVVALDDELLDTPAGDDELVGEAALLSALTADRTGRMREIVTTLQAEQDRIVRDEHLGVLVVQGGPGTGKTAVALHRLAYLLYTRPHLRSRGVLVIGPSRVFLDYIGQVLPGLGEHTVVTATLPDLWRGGVERVEVNVEKGRAEMAERVAAAVWARIQEETVEFEFEQQVVRLEPATWKRVVATAKGLPYRQARLVFERGVVVLLARELGDRMESVVLTEAGEAIDGGDADGSLSAADLRALAAAGVVVDPDEPQGPRHVLDDTDRAGLRAALLADAGVREVLDRVWPPLTAEQVVAGLVGTTAWSTADVPLLDEAAAVLGEGVPTFGHVVVDEAQELSEMDWRMLVRRCPARSMTIVGDLAQTGSAAGASGSAAGASGSAAGASGSAAGATGWAAGATGWAEVLRPHVADRWRLAQLTVNYRTPAEIMAATEELFAAHHPGLRPPRSVRSTGEQPWRLGTTAAELADVVARLVAAHQEGRWPVCAPPAHQEEGPAVIAQPGHHAGNLAVIAPPVHRERLAEVLPVAGPPELTEPVVLLTPGEAKGLEFDAVLIVDPAAILAAGPLGHNDLYVAMTRATRRLGVVHPGPCPAVLAGLAASPGGGNAFPP
ncbi:ATP-binding domain-containing protein [Amycolatopsis sp. 195334CR]|uniref:HelD family protein n=1 Tax=Amycolatopsis sp. 195334CR TaxID=2814588 RepID=UPI001A8DF33F|nr:ATP-binding domain-containing protein [Amycolatopsis sp. 195334CR]MBN6036553.1 AAA family ATPase [Amycolatopsis sp. 195334CR]